MKNKYVTILYHKKVNSFVKFVTKILQNYDKTIDFF